MQGWENSAPRPILNLCISPCLSQLTVGLITLRGNAESRSETRSLVQVLGPGIQPSRGESTVNVSIHGTLLFLLFLKELI